MNSKNALTKLSNMTSPYYWRTKEQIELIKIVEQSLDRLEKLEKEIKDGTLSDGYHTFNELYEQRMYLFATIVNQNKDKSWKSFKHEDGKLCFDGDWFVVGIDTPKGSYTYHYENKYWNLFDCQELEVAKHWDGHTDKDVSRLLSLEPKLEILKENRKLKKGIEIIKNKNVDIFDFFDLISLEVYNYENSKRFGLNDYNLTQEEYELLKEVLFDER